MSEASDNLSDVALAILAGGQGSRMGLPKIELLLDGQPILHALLDRIAWPGPTLLSVAADHPIAPGSDRFTRVIADRRPGEGPLRGLHAVLADAPTPYVVVTAVDMPLVGRNQLGWLASRLKADPEAQGLMTVLPSPDGGAAQIEPLPSAFRADFAPAVAHLLARNRRALHGLASHPRVKTVAPPTDWPADTWTNLNTPADLEAVEHALNARRR